MKTKYNALFSILFFVFAFSQQEKSYDLLKDKIDSKILYDKVFAVSDATHLKTDNISCDYFLQVYYEMQRADFLQRFPKLETLQEEANIGFSKNQIPLSVLVADFESIKPEAFENKQIQLNSKNQYEVVTPSDKIFEKHQINLLAPLLAKTKSLNPEFVLNEKDFFNTTSRKISFIEIQNQTSWKKISFNEKFVLSFKQNGINKVNYKIHFEDGTVLQQSFSINIQHQKTAEDFKISGKLQPNAVTGITASIPYQGYGETAAYKGQGEYEIFLDTVDGVLDKPIILLDGFDPGDTRNTSAIYQLLNYGTSGQNLGDVVRAQGYDLVVLNFPQYTRTGTTTVIDGGTDYVQRNAMILVELLNLINSQKVGANKNVVIGPSMGGLISRYALRYMEQHSMNHDARLYISFDSPHLGANVPIGFQHLFNYMGFGPVGDVSMQALVNSMLKSPAAREMLLDHFEGHLQSGSTTEFNTSSASMLPTGCPNYRAPFQTELNTMGFPQTTRNVAIINGAGNGTMTGTPGMLVMNHTFNTSSTQRAIINLHFTPAKNQTTEVSHFQGQQWILFWITFYDSAASSKSPTTSDGLDSAPGGRFNMASLAAGSTNAMLTEFLNNLQIQYFDFIPATSAMALSGVTNYYSNITSAAGSPFAAAAIPSVNENHVTFDDQNVTFALNEILGSSTLAANNDISKNIFVENPVKSSIKIFASRKFKNSRITISDFSGRTIFIKENADISGTFELPINLTKGIYMLNISSEGETFNKKIVKE